MLQNLVCQLGGRNVSARACGATSSARSSANNNGSARLPGMGMWFDIMRDMEHLMHDYTNIFDAWEAGGVDGLVIGPLTFNSPDLIKVHESPAVYAVLPAAQCHHHCTTSLPGRARAVVTG